MPLPDYVLQEHLTFLDDLQESGATNMLGAGPYLQKVFGLTRYDANSVAIYWMETFATRHAIPAESADLEEGSTTS